MINFSCGKDNSCIEADDFGNIETETIEVYSSSNSSCRTDDIPLENTSTKYDNISCTDLKNCLESTPYITKQVGNTIETLTCKLLLLDAIKSKTEEMTSQQKDNIDYAITKLPICENFCISSVKNLVSSSAPPWKTNNPLGSYGNSVRIKPDTQIFMKLSGQITLSQNPNPSQTTYSIVGDNRNDKNNLLNIYKNISSSLRKSESGEKLNGSYNFNIVRPNSYYNNQKADDSPLNLEQILRRNLVVFKKFPPQLNQSLYDDPQAINPDLSSLIMCDNSQYSNEKTKIKCSYTTNSESIAKAYGINNENENTFGTAGGFVRSNSVDYSSKDEFQNVLESITLNDSNPTGIAQGVLVGADSYINLRIDDRSCSNYKVDVAINDGANDVYKINNLSLNPNYSSFDIPFYNGSSINITPSDRIPTSNLDNQPCYKKIDILAKKYRDIIMPTSGFVEFKMHVTGANPTCKLFARIINPQGEKN